MQVAVDQKLTVIFEITFFLQIFDLAEENLRIQYDTVADDTALARVQDP